MAIPGDIGTDSVKAGLDDPKVIEAVNVFLAELEQGNPVDRQELVRLFPGIADELATCLDGLQLMHRVAPQLRDSHEENSTSRSTKTVQAAVTLGDFHIVREIGRGGMGVVYEAEQLSLGRTVALKVLPFAAMLDHRQLQRFKNEAQAAALLHHHNIVPVHGIGCNRGVHYYAMQYIEGQTLAAVIDSLRKLQDRDVTKEQETKKQSWHEYELTMEHVATKATATSSETQRTPQAALSTERSTKSATYLRNVAELGIQVAEALEHAHEEGVVHRDIKPSNLILDERGKVWVTDFGLARIGSDPGLSMTGDIVGTLRYMSPEQALAKRVVVDQRTDIYSLCTTLYELLTLQPVFGGKDRQELIKQIAFEEPLRPRRLNRRIPTELETIVLKGLEKNPGHRYGTAKEVADDLRRFLDDKPIHAKPPSLAQRAAKWSRRHRPLVASLSATLAFILLTIVAVAWAWAVRMDRVAEQQRALAHQAQLERANAENAKRQIAHRLADEYLDRGQVLAEQGKIGIGMLWMAESLRTAPADSEKLRRAARAGLAAWSRRLHALVGVFRHQGPVRALAFSPDGSRVLSGSADQTAQLLDTVTGRPIGSPIMHDSVVRAVAFSPDGLRVATGSEAGAVRLVVAATGKQVGESTRDLGAFRQLTFNADGTRLAANTGRGVQLLDAATGGRIGEPRAPPSGEFYTIAFGRQGTVLGILSDYGVHQLVDVISGEPIGEAVYQPNSPHGAIHAEDLTFATASFGNGRARLWDAVAGEPVAQVRAAAGVQAVAISPGGTRLLTGGNVRTARLWDMATDSPIGQPLRHQRNVGAVAFSPDGSRVATGSDDGTVRLWALAGPGHTGTALQTEGFLAAVAFSPDGTRILTGGGFATAQLWNAVTGERVGRPIRHEHPFLPDSFLGRCYVVSVAFTPDGSRLLTGWYDGAHLWDAETGKPIGSGIPHPGWCTAAISPDGLRIATVNQRGALRLWDAATGDAVGQPLQMSSLRRVAFSPDGEQLLTGGGDGAFRRREADTLEPIGEPFHHASEIMSVAFSPDSSRAVTALTDGTARVWDLVAHQTIGRLLQHEDFACAAAFSPDGTLVLTGSRDKTARFWDTETGKAVGPPLQHGASVNSLAFSPDGAQVVLAGGHVARIWEAPPPPVEGVDQRIALWVQVITGMELELDSAGGVRVLDGTTWLTRLRRLQQLGGPPVSSAIQPVHHLAEAGGAPHVRRERDRLAARKFAEELDWSEVVSHLDNVLLVQPQDRTDFLARGRAHAELGAWDKACADYAEALRLGADAEAVRLQIAGLIAADQRVEASEKIEYAFRELLRLWNTLAEEFPGQRSYRKGLARTQFEWGRLLKSAGRPQEATQQWRQMLETVPDPFVDFRVRVTTPGTYRLYVRWAGQDDQSNSFYARIVELGDGPHGTVADWYHFRPPDNHFERNIWQWDGSAGFENAWVGFNEPALWTIGSPGDFTVRIFMREDGAAVDALLLQLAELASPSENDPVGSARVVGETFVETNGQLLIEAERFSFRRAVGQKNWLVAPLEDAGIGDHKEFRGTGFLQVLPDERETGSGRFGDGEPIGGSRTGLVGSLRQSVQRWTRMAEAADTAEVLPRFIPATWLLLAKAHAGLGDQQEGRKWYDQAARWIEQQEMGRRVSKELLRLRSETALLLGVDL